MEKTGASDLKIKTDCMPSERQAACISAGLIESISFLPQKRNHSRIRKKLGFSKTLEIRQFYN
jgi:hypothetical protein